MINPVGYRVLVEPFEVETTTESGIQIVLDEDREFAGQEYGTIVAIGPMAWDNQRELWAKVGDKIIYSKYGGKIVKAPHSDKRYVILNDEDVLAKLED